MKPKFHIALCIGWIAICLLRIGSRWDALYWFLFSVSKNDPRYLPEFDPNQVWRASDAIWWLFGLIAWGTFLIFAIVRHIKSKCDSNRTKIKEGEQVGDGDAEEAV